MRLVYICAPYGGDPNNARLHALYAATVAQEGDCPVSSVIMLHDVLDDYIPDHRKAGMQLSVRLVSICDIVYVFGNCITAGMRIEIERAEALGVEVVYRLQ